MDLVVCILNRIVLTEVTLVNQVISEMQPSLTNTINKSFRQDKITVWSDPGLY